MNRILVIALLGLAVASAAVFKEEEYQLMFGKFMTQYNKKYNHDTFFYRYTVFKANMDKIALSNKQGHAYKLGMNEMGDMTHAEFKATKLGYNRRERSYLRAKNGAPKSNTKVAIPDSVNWVTSGAVTAVKNQQQCGSCWSFSTTGAMEGAVAIATGTLQSLSEQQLIDCSTSFGNQGCNGGLMDNAFQYIIQNGGLTTEEKYPYTATGPNTCNTTLQSSPFSTIGAYVDVTSSDEDALAAAVAIGPVSVAIEADQNCFQFYSGGILNDPSCGTNLDHGVLAVGYGNTPSDYWYVKNSWGASWGVDGYVMLAKGLGGVGQCGIATEPSYPTQAKLVNGKHTKARKH